MKLKKLSAIAIMALTLSMGIVVSSYANENIQTSNQETKTITQQSRATNGWQKDEYGNWKYYKNGVVQVSQWIKENGKWYYLNEYGDMLCDDAYMIGTKTYLFDKTGAMVEKKGWIKAGDEYFTFWHYGNGDGTVKANQWHNENGKWYYFFEAGFMAGGDGFQVANINGKSYAFNKDGSMIEKEGWYRLANQYYNSWYWVKKDGTVKANSWVKDNNKWYYLDEEGMMVEGYSYEIGDKTYLFGRDGVMMEKKGWLKIDYPEYGGADWYYGNGDGTVKVESWIQDGGKWYYVYYDGIMVVSTSIEIDVQTYYFDENGVCTNK